MLLRSLAVGIALAVLATACNGPTGDSSPVGSVERPAEQSTEVPDAAEIPEPPRLAAGATICDLYESPVAVGEVASAELVETSGIVASRTYPEVLWAHNDSGDAAAIHAIGSDGSDLGRFRIANAIAIDWEDIAIGPGPNPEQDYLYVADIGDNLSFRGRVSVYRFVEPAPGRPGGLVENVERFDLSYGEEAFDAEALIVDPITGTLAIVTKRDAEGRSIVFTAGADELVDGRTVTIRPVAILNLGPGARVTAADFASDGTAIALRGYDEVWMWPRTAVSIGSTFEQEPCRAPAPAEPGGGESLAFAPDSYSYYTVAEGARPPIHYTGSLLS